MIRKTMLALAAATGALIAAMPAQAQAFTGQILMSGFGACPAGTRLANGDLLPIQKAKPTTGEDYRDLYALYGTAYGGDGETSFALPDMRAQVIAANDIGKVNPSGKRAAENAPPAMRVDLPIVFCVVTHGIKPALK